MSTENNEKTFTQKEVDEIVQTRLGKEEKKHATLLKSIEDGLNQKIKELEESNKELTQKALKVDDLSTQLETATKERDGLKVEKEQREFQEKLKSLDIKEDRIEQFAKMLGEDKSDEGIKALKEQLPEWVKSEEVQETKPEPTPQIVVGGNPSTDTGTAPKSWRELMNENVAKAKQVAAKT